MTNSWECIYQDPKIKVKTFFFFLVIVEGQSPTNKVKTEKRLKCEFPTQK